MRTRSTLIVSILAALCTAVVVASAVGADTGTGALANFTANKVKLHQTGATIPNSSWTLVGRLQLPVGSWVIDGRLNVYSVAGTATPVDCYLMAPNATPGHAEIELGATKGTNGQSMGVLTATNAPNGGNADLLCRVSNKAADRAVFAQGIAIVATSVSGVTVTRNGV